MNRIGISLILIITATLACNASYTSDVMMYIAKYQSYALQSQYKYGVPASITLAQGILESGCGKSLLTRQSHNHFGIKGRGPAGSVKAKDDEPGLSTFCAYHNDQQSYDDHARLLCTKRYRSLHNYSIWDYRNWAHGIKACGYATAPNYAESLIGIIEKFQLYKINNGKKLRAGKRVVVRRVKVKKPKSAVAGSLATSDSIPEFEDEDMVTLTDSDVSSEEQELENAIKNYESVINGVPCMVLLPGKTLGTICRDYRVDKSKILKYNEVKTESQFSEGDIVFLDKKKDKFTEGRDSYRVREGDTLYGISQKFGIKVLKLAKLNDIKNIEARLRPGLKLNLN